jgi:hypothetical protein
MADKVGWSGEMSAMGSAKAKEMTDNKIAV